MKKLIFALFLVGIVVLASGCETKSEVKTQKSLTLSGITVYYSGDVSLGEAKNLIGFLKNELGSQEMDVYLEKDGNSYRVGIVSSYSSESDIDPGLRFYLSLLPSKMSQDLFDGAKVKLEILDTDKNVLYSSESKYSYVESSGIVVWYSGTPEENARKVLDYAVSLVGEGPWDIIMEENNGIYHISAVSSFESADDIGTAETTYRQMVKDLSPELNGKVVLHVLSPEGKEIAVFP
ncbi:hypothetical protein VFC49_05385 [Thermococcus sp. SY098]|uniref:hypothetical protein n=1 Tax=Thermococcus sp. SY098 TaxID=3111325 RepID=UPI002D76EAC3|nr:hypothetical protein [Thermococcus sp. SY098]WRS53531.1 hypothetical protein VFC49_05385 [Thermococcus sp. SY098]